ncbi:hypothetical protein [Azomonas macrocytogenes]|uniref:Uncharacterized protein n=1 Tax=Azomonas macrocytogenes TaxID=69962 RepID=A0A839T2Y6_AZOMA|nr:hypothetical protein [Azomonas macrocytogenes]MBB3103907.1 hypothetical protein [Azomonas macrocytogenes]
MAFLKQRIEEAEPLFAEIWQIMALTLQKAGLDPLVVFGQVPNHSELREDSFDQTFALYTEWRTQIGVYLGNIVVNGNGQSFAEFDVLLPHPQKPCWFVEAVTAWGVYGELRSELRLLPALEE